MRAKWNRLSPAGKVLILVFLAGIVFLPLGLFVSALLDAQHQQTVIRTYVPAEGTVLSSQITSSNDNQANQYQVEVSYRYEVNKQTYRSFELAPLPLHGTGEWAQSIRDRFKPGQPCPVFYNPKNPSQAILLRHRSFEPYLNMLLMVQGMPMALFLAILIGFEQRAEPQPAENGWFEILPKLDEKSRLLAQTGAAAIWYFSLTITLGHFFLCFPPPHLQKTFILFGVFSLLGLIPTWFLLRTLQGRRNFGGVRLLMDQPAATLGHRFRFTFLLAARRQFRIKLCRVRVYCRQAGAKKGSYSFTTTPVEFSDRVVQAGEVLRLPVELTLPADGHPTGVDISGKFARINWAIEWKCRPDHGPASRRISWLTVKQPDVMLPCPAEETPAAQVEIQPVDPSLAGKILTTKNIALTHLLGGLPIIFILLGIFLFAVTLHAAFPTGTGDRPLLPLPPAAAKWVFFAALATTLAATIWGLRWPSRLSGSFLHYITKKSIARRRDAIVAADGDSLYVQIIPRDHWNWPRWKNASDIGFMKLDKVRREILFEGDRQRFRIPASALVACELAAISNAADAPKNMSPQWLVLLRARDKNGIGEAPICRMDYKHARSTAQRREMAKNLREEILALLPIGRRPAANPGGSG